MPYKVKTKTFEGPLELLLELIEKEKLEITEISISKVANQYLEHVENKKDIDPAQLADFLVIAAKLLFIKSKVFLPVVEVQNEEDASVEELEFRLRQYKQFKQIGEQFKERFLNKKVIVDKVEIKKQKQGFYPGINTNPLNLHNALAGLVSYFEKQKVQEEKKIEKTVTISEKISRIQDLLNIEDEHAFDTLIESKASKPEIVVTFLALLELIKTNTVSVSQEKLFEPIMIKKSSHEKIAITN